MQPIPCAHCAINFMRNSTNPETPRLCNSCILKEEIRNPKKGNKMETVDILIKCSSKMQREVEEICLNLGVSFSEYFIKLHQVHSIQDMKP